MKASKKQIQIVVNEFERINSNHYDKFPNVGVMRYKAIESGLNLMFRQFSDAVEQMTLNDIWETLHAAGYKIGDVETMYAEWVYHNEK